MVEQKKKKRGKIALYFLYAAITIFILVMILSFNDISNIFNTMATADIVYVLIALGLLVLYLALSPISLCLLNRSRKNDISFRKTYVIGMTEHFFNGITPFATGGQPFQIYAFSRSKIKPAESTSLLLMNFLVHMIAANIFAVCALFFFPKFATDTFMIVVAIVGFSINFSVLLGTVVIGTSKTVRRFLMWCVRILCKIKFVAKFLKPQEEKLALYFEQVQTVFKDLVKKPGTFLSCLGVKLLAFAVYYTITFFIIRALHIDVGFDQLFFIMCGTAFAVTMCVFLPTPGSSGGVELAFATVFASIIGTSTGEGSVAYGGMLMWRLMTYYLAMIISLLFYVGFEIQYNVNKRKELSLAPEIINENSPGSETKDENITEEIKPAAETVADDDNPVNDIAKANGDIQNIAEQEVSEHVSEDVASQETHNIPSAAEQEVSEHVPEDVASQETHNIPSAAEQEVSEHVPEDIVSEDISSEDET